MSGEGGIPTVEEQIATLTAQMTVNAERLRALEAENIAIQATNDEPRALIDGVIPDNETTECPNPIPNGEQEVNKTALVAPTGPVIPYVNPNVGQNQQTPQTARVEIDLNNLPV